MYYPRLYYTAKPRLTSMVVFRSTSVASLAGHSWSLGLEVVELAVLRLELLVVFCVELLAAIRRERVVAPVAALELERGRPQVLGSSRWYLQPSIPFSAYSIIFFVSIQAICHSWHVSAMLIGLCLPVVLSIRLILFQYHLQTVRSDMALLEPVHMNNLHSTRTHMGDTVHNI